MRSLKLRRSLTNPQASRIQARGGGGGGGQLPDLGSLPLNQADWAVLAEILAQAVRGELRSPHLQDGSYESPRGTAARLKLDNVGKDPSPTRER